MCLCSFVESSKTALFVIDLLRSPTLRATTRPPISCLVVGQKLKNIGLRLRLRDSIQIVKENYRPFRPSQALSVTCPCQTSCLSPTLPYDSHGLAAGSSPRSSPAREKFVNDGNGLRKCIRLPSGAKLRAIMSCARTGPHKDLGLLRTVLYHRLPARRLNEQSAELHIATFTDLQQPRFTAG